MREIKIEGFTFTVQPEPSDYWDWIDQGLYQSDVETIKRFAWPQVSCIDAGAWVGAYTLLASRLYKHVYAIEPDPVALDILMRNLAANHLDNVTVYQGALMGHCGMTSVGSTVLGSSCTRETCKDNAVAVSCTTLREFCKEIPDPLFIKMDVEGAEAQILEDWQFFSERKPDLMLSVHPDWWREAGSDGKREYAAITKVGKLYRNAWHSGMECRLNFDVKYGDVVFTDN